MHCDGGFTTIQSSPGKGERTRLMVLGLPHLDTHQMNLLPKDNEKTSVLGGQIPLISGYITILILILVIYLNPNIKQVVPIIIPCHRVYCHSCIMLSLAISGTLIGGTYHI